VQTLTSLPPARFRTYQSTEFAEVWDEVRPLIQRALDRGSEYDINDILLGLSKTEMQLWTCETDHIQAALITSLQDDFCLLLAIGGDNMTTWKHWIPAVESWAKAKGCREMRIYGRRGWSKALGYRIEFTKMSKAL
jgi:hypothetical protein